MFRLSFIILLLITSLTGLYAQSPHESDLKLDCSVCHESNNWNIKLGETKFQHETTGFSLLGQHALVNCRSCHESLIFKQAEPDCNTCHVDIHQETVGLDCSVCHTSKSWMVEDMNGLHQESRFPLFGKHLITDCQQCHSRYVDLYFEPLKIDCYSCHSQNFNTTNSPNHIAAGFSTDCEVCHSVTAESWTGTTSIPGATTIHDFFPLLGGHAIQDCFSCHEQGGNFSGLSQDCFACHQQNFEATQDPNHIEAGFSTDCVQCHTTNDWVSTGFDHNQSIFPLVGSHTTVDCSSCHTDGFSGTPTDCYTCHQTVYEQTSNPNHTTLALSTNCEDCHTVDPNWQPASFSIHGQFYQFFGAHSTISEDCNTCHDGDYNNTPNTCFGCHEDSYNATTDPPHLALNFSQDCVECHNQGSWIPSNFDHDQTSYPLTGSHNTVDCSSCHTDGLSGTPTDCYTCHQTLYEQTSNPNHITLALPTSCEDCHTTNPSWQPASFAIHGQFYQFFGGHSLISEDCNSCHNGDYNNTPNTCFGCHEDNYNATTDPPHQALNFSQDCVECHNQGSWIPSNFDHNFYPLSGLHSDFSCSDCHSESEYQPQCISCHQEIFEGVHDSGFPTDCWNCHATSGWATGGNIFKMKRTR